MRALPALYAGYAHAFYVFVNIKSAKLIRLGVIIDEKFAFLANVLRYVRYMLSAVRMLSVCLLSVCLSVCDVGAPYSGG